jgi:hypothetical protein
VLHISMEGSDRRTVLSKTDEVVLKNVKQQLMSRNVKLQVCEIILFLKLKRPFRVNLLPPS